MTMMRRLAIMTTSISPEHREHDRFLVNVRSLLEKVPKFDEEMIYIDALGYDQPEVKRRLKPAAEKDQTGKSTMVSCWCSLRHKPGMFLHASGHGCNST